MVQGIDNRYRMVYYVYMRSDEPIPTAPARAGGTTMNAQPAPDFYDTANELEALLLKLKSIEGYKLLAQLRYAYEDIERECTAERANVDAIATDYAQVETKLEDIHTTLDMVTTGYRDFSDLARTIQA